MTITCPKCKTSLILPEDKLKPEGTRFRCSKCRATLFYKGKGGAPQGNAPESEPLSPPPPCLEPQTSHPSAVSDTEIQQSHELQPIEQADAGTIAPGGATAERRSADANKEMLKKIGPALEKSEQIPVSVTKMEKVAPRKAVLAGAAAILIVVIIAIFFFYSQDNAQRDLMHAPSGDKGVGMSPPSPQGKEAVSQAAPAGSVSVEPPQRGDIAEGLPSLMTEEKAIEIVKRSEALLNRTPVDSIVKKWTEENAAKFKIVGWQAKKMDEQKYFVSYTALDGDVPKGFYFELDVQSGIVKDFARNPELQKKYNIQ